MQRRNVLIAIGGLSMPLAGCLGQASPSSQPSDSSTVSPTPSETDNSQVELPPCPEKPDPLTEENVVGFATRFEEAYAARVALPTDTDNIEVVHVSANKEDAEVTHADGGWVVHFTVREPTFTYTTPTEGPHYDPGFYFASYFVSDETVLQARGTEYIDPRENGEDSPGEPVSCPPWSR